MPYTKGVNSIRVVRVITRRAIALFTLALSVVLAGLPGSTQAAAAGVWQTPLTFWLVDGYQFGEYVEWSEAYHLGEDAHGEPGTPVYAPANGTVRLAIDMNGGGWGGLVLIENDNQAGDTVVSLHGHLDFATVQVKDDQYVSRGQLLGYLGDSETNGGWVPHLHFGIRNGRYVDAYAGEDWVYYGYGSEEDMADWLNPTQYIEARKNIIEVLRVPENSPNRYTTAVGVSTRRFPDAGSAKQGFIASGTSFADALAGAPVTKAGNAPLLLATNTLLPPETAAELKRSVPKGGVVHIIGGAQTIAPEVEQAIQQMGFTTHRIAGANRETTATRIANLFPYAKSVFIVNRDAFPDAVSAGGPSNALGLPLLFTSAESLNEVTQQYLLDHPNITSAYIIGGESVIGSQVEQKLKQLKTLKTVERVAGPNRYETNIAVVKKFTPKPETLVLATGENYPDALTGSSLVSAEKGSLLLTRPAGYTQSTRAFMETTRPALDAALVLGGPAAISGALDSTLAASLNEPLTLASAPIESHDPHNSYTATGQHTAPQQPIVVRAHEPVLLSGVSVPSISGYTPREKVFNGAVRAELGNVADSAELAPPVTITRIPLAGRSAETTLANWFSVSEQFVQQHQTQHEQYVALHGMPTLVRANMSYRLEGQDLILVEIRLPDTQAEQAHAHIFASITPQ